MGSLISQVNYSEPKMFLNQSKAFESYNSSNGEILNKFFYYNPTPFQMAVKCAPEKARTAYSPLEGSCQYEFQIPSEIIQFCFKDKVEFFKKSVQKLKIDWREGSDYLDIMRERLVESSMEQIKKVNLYKELKINFSNEINQDAGGLIREWLTVLMEDIQLPKWKLFEKADTQEYSIKISSNIDRKSSQVKEKLNFIGKVLGKALLENLTINTSFNCYFYKIFLDEKISFNDLLFIDEKLFHSLQKLDTIENIEELELYFAKSFNDSHGNLKTQNLMLNGSEVKVTKENLSYYKECQIRYLINKDRMFINEIKKGLVYLIPENLIKIFSASEFELLLNGTPFIDLEDWKSHTIYEEYYANDKLVINFWDIMQKFDQVQLGTILQFCTGSKRVPIGGFKSLESNRGNKAFFCIKKGLLNQNGKSYIRAHTCFNRLDIPSYRTKEELQEALNYVLNNEIIGFGIE